MHTAARQKSVAAPTVDAMTAITARERLRNTALRIMMVNIRPLVIVPMPKRPRRPFIFPPLDLPAM
jgi:hypothetical protein